MLAPAAAVAGGFACDVGAVAAATCCCDDGGRELAADGPARIERTCCCELRKAPATRHLDQVIAPAPVAPDPLLAAVGIEIGIIPEPPTRTDAAAVRARGPPPAPTLLAQRVAFLC